MNIVNNQLLGDLVTLSTVIYFFVLAWALWTAPWKAFLQRPERLHVILGTCVLIMLLWKMRAGVSPGLDIHFLGMTALTLIAGWQMAIIGAGLTLAGVSLFTEVDWFNYPVNALLTGVVPILTTVGMLNLAGRFLPRHFFIYIYINAFLAGMVAISASSVVAAGMLWVSGEYDLGQLSREYLAYLPLLAFPEGFVNGMVMTGLVVLRPEWVATFNDDLYLKGK